MFHIQLSQTRIDNIKVVKKLGKRQEESEKRNTLGNFYTI